VTKEEARTFADQSGATPADAVEAGWPYPSELKEPDFDALHGRADFPKLVADVEGKARPKAKPKDGSPPKRRVQSTTGGARLAVAELGANKQRYRASVSSRIAGPGRS